MPRVLLPLAISLQTQLGTCTGISLVDSISLAVCHNARIAPHRPASPRIAPHRVFRVDARRGKTSVGWFYGFKLHLVVNDRGELLAFCLTPGNVADRRPVPRLIRRLFGQLFGGQLFGDQLFGDQLFGDQLFGDRGSISQALAERLFTMQGILLISKLRPEHAGADPRLHRHAAVAEADHQRECQ